MVLSANETSLVTTKLSSPPTPPTLPSLFYELHREHLANRICLLRQKWDSISAIHNEGRKSMHRAAKSRPW